MTYHIQPMWLSNQQREQIFQSVKALKPPMVVVMDDLGFALSLKPHVKWVVYRDIALGDANNVSLNMPASVWLDAHTIPGNAGLVLYAENEASDDPRTIQWLYDVAVGCLQRNWRVCLGNYAVGNPNHLGWSKFDSLLRLISQNPNKLFWGEHQYYPSMPFAEFAPSLVHPNQWGAIQIPASEKPFINGRHRWLIDYCKLNNFKPPQIMLTEFGSDEIPALYHIQKNYPHYAYAQGYVKAQNMYRAFASDLEVADYIMKSLKAIWDKIYFHDTNYIVGVALFTISGTVWHDFDLLDISNLIQKITSNNPFKFKENQVENYKIHNEGTKLEKVQITHSSNIINLREKPWTGALDVGDLLNNQIIEIYTDSLAYDTTYNYTWHKTKDGKWFAKVSNLQWIVLNDLKAMIDEAISILNSVKDQLPP